MQRSSQQDADPVVLTTVGLPLGRNGLDLRQPSNAESLTSLLNARFIDDRCLQAREGHRGILVRDKSDLAHLGDSYTVSDRWIYGHGMQVSAAAVAGWENAHHPFPHRASTTFNYDGTDVLFTGDRLLMVREDGPALGQASYWQRGASSTALDRGIPAFLPLQVDSTPPALVSGNYVETALTTTLRCHAYVDSANGLWVWLIDRATGTVIQTSEISGASNAPVECKIIQSADVPVVVWRDSATNRLYINTWNGQAWTGATQVVPEDVFAFDVAVVPGGFHLLWRTAAPSAVTLCAGYYARTTKQSSPYVFGTALGLLTRTPNGAIALGVSPAGELGVAAQMSTGNFQFQIFSSTLVSLTPWVTVTTPSGLIVDAGASVMSRGLKNSAGRYDWVVHAAVNSTGAVYVFGMGQSGGGATFPNGAATVRYNSRLASKSFRVGDEVFCWLRGANAGTHYLIGGCGELQVCGYADREEAIARTLLGGNYGIPHVLADPLDDDAATFTWARPYNTGQAYAHGGNVRVGDIDFLAPVTAARFGKSVYLSGSAVRAWDGVVLGDTGFQDYPIVTAATPVSDGTGGILSGARMYYRVYAVRYNARGERFQSAAVSFGPTAAAPGAKNRVDLTIATLPDTNHSDVVFEIYRTENLGTTFYLVGTVANSFAASTVSFSDKVDDVTLITQTADPHAPGVGALAEVEEWGPLGCAILVSAGDRLWGAGGQVPAGNVQFSKLKEEGEGAGFDALAGFQTVDPEGHAITSVAPLNDFTVVFEKDRLFVIQGTGPDNYGRNGFVVPVITLADGAAVHAGTVVTQLGVFYWGDSGPRLLTTALQVEQISQPVRSLSETFFPTGVISHLARQEVIWYSDTGKALLLNYLNDSPRWAEWSGLEVAGCSAVALAMVDGRLLIPDENAVGDDGQGFEFSWATGNLRPEQILQGYTLLRSVGISGLFLGEHQLRMRVFYNGSPLWTDEWVWQPETQTWLSTGEDHADQTPADVDAENPRDRSGAYATHKKVTRGNCQYFKVEVSNIESDRPSYIPYELSLELGARGGLGRVPVNSFGA